MSKKYQDKVIVLIDKGEVDIPIEDCDMLFYIEDTLNSLNVDFQKLIRPPKRSAPVTLLTIRIKEVK
ncbi:hypothetical protein [Peribacillus deserti]|uniref:Uncharacterized protein n=1 Tax=Peribacillus deserti TaxID=673318 RepID=A0A2N5M520_9BACI|nr:hypothetical protein [Peribacillus deserti]PLT29471.1 hypothetical protein CUU66_12865 [Peribacillus deserti]